MTACNPRPDALRNHGLRKPALRKPVPRKPALWLFAGCVSAALFAGGGCGHCCSTWDYTYPVHHCGVTPLKYGQPYARSGSIGTSTVVHEGPTPAEYPLPTPGDASAQRVYSEPGRLPQWSSAQAQPALQR